MADSINSANVESCLSKEEYRVFRRAEWMRQYRKENKDNIRNQGKRWAQENGGLLRERRKERRLDHPDLFLSKRRAYNSEHKEEIAQRAKAYYGEHKTEIRERSRLYREQSRDKQRESCREYYYKDHEKSKRRLRVAAKANKEKRQEYANRKYANDVNFRLRKLIRSRIFRSIGGKAKPASPIKALGCTLAELKAYLESKFQMGMAWENWGVYGWHVDHIRPLASFDLTDPVQFGIACHYTNLQPLWAKDNLSKSDKFEESVILTVEV